MTQPASPLPTTRPTLRPANPMARRPATRLRHLAGAIALTLGLATPLMLTGCAGPAPTDYASQTPPLDLKQYFNGKLLAHGIVTDRSGKVLQRFTVALTGTWVGDTGTLDERFSYADGRKETRVWTLQRGPDGRYTGRAADVLGEAAGQAAGNALNWRYTLLLPVDGRTWEVQFDDWMFLVDDQVMINRAVMSKFGIRVGEVLLSFQRLPA